MLRLKMLTKPILPNQQKTGNIPLFLNTVKAGFPSPAADYEEKSIDFNEILIRNPAATFTVKASGSSMTGAGIFPGDYLIVDRSLNAMPGSIVVAAVDGDFTVKRLVRKNGMFALKAENPDYPEIKISRESELTVWGVVTFVIHPLYKTVYNFREQAEAD
jgi:DNA polymerase V